MTDHNQPSSKWDYSHAANEGDIIRFFEDKEWQTERWQITSMDDEMVHVRRLDDGRVSANETESFPHEALNAQLAQGEAVRESDGLSSELATY